jgi:hypothetical protein
MTLRNSKSNGEVMFSRCQPADYKHEFSTVDLEERSTSEKHE